MGVEVGEGGEGFEGGGGRVFKAGPFSLKIYSGEGGSYLRILVSGLGPDCIPNFEALHENEGTTSAFSFKCAYFA